MNFSQLVRSKFDKLLFKYNFIITDELCNVIEYSNSSTYIIFSYNERENKHALTIGLDREIPIEMNDDIISIFFGSKISIDNKSVINFVGNCYSFFTLDGIEVLKNDNSILTKLEKNVIEESENYTLRLASEIKLKQISSTWNNKEYSKFLELTDKMAKVELTEIMKKKINIAKKHK